MSTNFSFHEPKAKTAVGGTFSLGDLKGQVVLVVNTATGCGLAPQFGDLEKLYQTYRSQGLAVVGFPCDQFAHQEPVSDAQMAEVCRVNHGVTFPLVAKSDVNGPGTNEVFQFLKKRAGNLFSSDIKWNFTKFLVSRDGKTVKRFAPTTKPTQLTGDIERLLQKK